MSISEVTDISPGNLHSSLCFFQSSVLRTPFPIWNQSVPCPVLTVTSLPQFIVIHIVKGFGIVNKAEIDVFLELSHFFNDPADVGNLISGSSAFS